LLLKQELEFEDDALPYYCSKTDGAMRGFVNFDRVVFLLWEKLNTSNG
jgi:hypothetical protein